MRKFFRILFILFAVVVGLYPLIYLFIDNSVGLLASKPAELISRTDWIWAFYQHISLGGVALLAGWSQFSQNLRAKNVNLHRTLGKIYVVACLLSGVAGLYLAFYATGGMISGFGFGGLAVAWLYTTLTAYMAARQGDYHRHERWMIRSYALTYAAVTLRLWMPVLIGGLRLEFMTAYLIVAWLCWVPNLLFAEVWIRTARA